MTDPWPTIRQLHPQIAAEARRLAGDWPAGVDELLAVGEEAIAAAAAKVFGPTVRNPSGYALRIAQNAMRKRRREMGDRGAALPDEGKGGWNPRVRVYGRRVKGAKRSVVVGEEAPISWRSVVTAELWSKVRPALQTVFGYWSENVVRNREVAKELGVSLSTVEGLRRDGRAILDAGTVVAADLEEQSRMLADINALRERRGSDPIDDLNREAMYRRWRGEEKAQ